MLRVHTIIVRYCCKTCNDNAFFVLVFMKYERPQEFVTLRFFVQKGRLRSAVRIGIGRPWIPQIRIRQNNASPTGIRIHNAGFNSVADPGCLSRIRIFSIADPGSISKNLSILTQKIVTKLPEIWSGLFIPDPDADFLYQFKGQNGTGPRIRIRNTGF